MPDNQPIAKGPVNYTTLRKGNVANSKRRMDKWKSQRAKVVESLITSLLTRCEEGDIPLEPALGRDPKAKFNPVE